MLIEAASLLREAKFSRTVRFVAFTCEEPPHFYQETMGSQVHAAQCRRSSEKITGMLCLEMVGFFKPDRANSFRRDSRDFCDGSCRGGAIFWRP